MGMMISEEHCPSCGKKVWVNLGDIFDLDVAAPDIDGLKCVFCGHSWLVPGLEESDVSKDWSEYAEETFRTPNEAAGLRRDQ